MLKSNTLAENDSIGPTGMHFTQDLCILTSEYAGMQKYAKRAAIPPHKMIDEPIDV